MWSPEAMQASNFLWRQTGDEMLSRLACFTVKPKVILDVGCGLGDMSAALAKLYPEASIISLDLELALLQAGDAASPVQANAAALPLKTGSVDLVVAHGLLPWVETWTPVIEEWRRVLAPAGVLMLSALGPDTLRECEAVNAIYPVRVDMHDLGDILIKAGFLEPVLDAAHFTIRYQALSRLEADLSGMGLPQFTCKPSDTGLQVTFEVIWAHTFAPALSNTVSVSDDGLARFPLRLLRRSERDAEYPKVTAGE